MASLNKVQLIGHLGRDVEVRYTGNGTAVATINLATSEQWKDKDGEKQERTEWHRVICWDKLAEICGEYLKKGSQVYFEGSLQTRKYTDKDGVEKYATEIRADTMKMLGKPAGERNDRGSDSRGSQRNGGGGNAGKKQQQDDFDDDIPF